LRGLQQLVALPPPARGPGHGGLHLLRLPPITETFTDRRLCAAVVDRPTFGGNIIETGPDYYRLTRARTARWPGSPGIERPNEPPDSHNRAEPPVNSSTPVSPSRARALLTLKERQQVALEIERRQLTACSNRYPTRWPDRRDAERQHLPFQRRARPPPLPRCGSSTSRRWSSPRHTWFPGEVDALPPALITRRPQSATRPRLAPASRKNDPGA
jgi:hypothetical protein